MKLTAQRKLDSCTSDRRECIKPRDPLPLLLSIIPLPLLVYLRDSGTLRAIADRLPALLSPLSIVVHQTLLNRFLRLSRHRVQHSYGGHRDQILELHKNPLNQTAQRPWIVFVHGGAWGSGRAWMYRLGVHSFHTLGFGGAVIVGYRTYPDASIGEQVQDVLGALNWLHCHSEAWCGSHQKGRIVLCGHSSGAHLITEAILRSFLRPSLKTSPQLPEISCVVCLSGIYDLGRHWGFESMRQVVDLSPMAPAAASSFTVEDLLQDTTDQAMTSPCHHRARALEALSPVKSLLKAAASSAAALRSLSSLPSRPPPSHDVMNVVSLVPPFLLVHGTEDTTVPYAQSVAFAQILSGLKARNGQSADVSTLWLEGLDHFTAGILLFPEAYDGNTEVEAFRGRMQDLALGRSECPRKRDSTHSLETADELPGPCARL